MTPAGRPEGGPFRTAGGTRPQGGALLTASGEAAPDRPTVTGSAAATLGWLTGRTGGAGLEAPQGLPALPSWI